MEFRGEKQNMTYDLAEEIGIYMRGYKEGCKDTAKFFDGKMEEIVNKIKEARKWLRWKTKHERRKRLWYKKYN